jgi:hypothetical protein
MSAPDDIGPIQEYQSLRQELLESKKYVFERPLLVAALAIAALNAVEQASVAVVPVLLTAFLLFNLWFTINRLFSAARIVAYIQLQLEERAGGPWQGWETSLREYRRWPKKLGKLEAKRIVDSELDKEALPDALMYYPAIYVLHIGIACLSVASSVLILITRGPTWLNVGCCTITVLLTAAALPYLRDHGPDFMKTTIERNRVIWKYVFAGMSSNTSLKRSPAPQSSAGVA